MPGRAILLGVHTRQLTGIILGGTFYKLRGIYVGFRIESNATDYYYFVESIGIGGAESNPEVGKIR